MKRTKDLQMEQRQAPTKGFILADACDVDNMPEPKIDVYFGEEKPFWDTGINPVTGWTIERWDYTDVDADERRERGRLRREL